MKAAVIDANVAVKWVSAEEHEDAAVRLLDRLSAMHAPAHWLAEASTAIWAKAAIHGLYGAEGIRSRLEALRLVPVASVPVGDLAVAAGAIAFDLRMTPYDALYLALAERLKIPLITADRRMIARAAASARLAGLVVWIGDDVLA